MLPIFFLFFLLVEGEGFDTSATKEGIWNLKEIGNARMQRRHWSQHLGQSLESLLDTIKSKPPKLADEDLRVFDMLGPVANVCNSMQSFGSGDEEKRFCGLNYTQLAGGGSCVVFSIGSNNQWGFEADIFKKTNCTVKTFDCTMRPDVQPPKELQDRVQLLRYCLGPSDEIIDGKQFYSYATLLRIAGLEGGMSGLFRPTALKMDIEGWEWSVLPALLNTGKNGSIKHSNLPEQMSFELHYVTNKAGKGLSWYNRMKTPGEIAIFMDWLYRIGGYMLIDRRDNFVCMSCSEIVVAQLPSVNSASGLRSSHSNDRIHSEQGEDSR